MVKNQYSVEKEVHPEKWGRPTFQTSKSKTAREIRAEYNLSHSIVEKYGAYSRAIDTLAKKTLFAANLDLVSEKRKIIL
jgi:hypothetical protein